MSEQQPQKSTEGGPSLLVVLLVLGAILALVIVAALAFIRQGIQQDVSTLEGPAIVEGDAFSTGVNDVEPTLISDVTLTSMDGGPLRLSDLRGKHTLIYFGYTYCPDFCPSTMTDWRLVRRALGDEADRVNFLMVSVDPARDTPEVLTQYLSRFDPAIIGATADDTTLTAMVAEFGAFYNVMDAGDAEFYMVDHTSSTFLLDPDGRLVTVYTFGTPVDIITEDLRAKLNL